MDDLWFSEYHTQDVRFSVRVSAQLHQEQSEYQRISVYLSPEFGRFLTLDGVLMLTERDEFIYHENDYTRTYGCESAHPLRACFRRG